MRSPWSLEQLQAHAKALTGSQERADEHDVHFRLGGNLRKVGRLDRELRRHDARAHYERVQARQRTRDRVR